MTDQSHSAQPPDPLDELTEQLLECGAVLSQLISGMVEHQASGRSAPDAAPIPEVAHSLVFDVLRSVRKGYSKRDIRVAAKIVEAATEAICNDIFIVGPELN
jgi:hypothetical protein